MFKGVEGNNAMKMDMFDFEDFEVPFDMVDDLAHNINSSVAKYTTEDDFFFSRFPPSKFHLGELESILSEKKQLSPIVEEDVPSFFSYEIITIGSGTVDYNLKSSLEELLKSGDANDSSIQIKSAPAIEIVTEVIAAEKIPSPSLIEVRNNSSSNLSGSSGNEKEDVGDEKGQKRDSPRKHVDKWGFVVEDPTDLGETLSKSKRKQQHLLEEKWLQILREWDDYNADRKKRVRRRFRKGIPDKLRGEMWKKITNTNEIQRENPTLYEALLKDTSGFEGQIQRDINRTFPKHVFFQERGGMGQTALFNVMKAYSVYDKTVGYCQGMGFLIAMFLLYMTEEDAFFLLSRVIKDYEMSGLFSPGFPSMIRCFYVHEQLLTSHLPRLAAHFEQQMVSASMYATQWYATVYAISLPFPFVIRIWDVFLVYGFNILYKVGIAILKFMQRDLLKEEFEGIMKILRNLNKYLTVTPDEFINSIMEFQLSDKKLQKISKDYEASQGQVWK